MRIGYNTNGFAHHRLEDALEILADLGYESVAITLDHHALNPFDADFPRQLGTVRRQLERLKLPNVIETGARFLLDPRRKHQPTLISPTEEERARRLDFLCKAVDIAHELGSDAVSFWSGTASDNAPPEELQKRLLTGCIKLCDHAEAKNVRLAFEPEPGMFIDTMDCFRTRVFDRISRPIFGVTIDLGHLHCQGESILAELPRWEKSLFNIHIEDMRRGVHDHLFFGEGEMEFPPILRTLADIGYKGGLHVELSRHSHDAVRTAERAIKFLKSLTAGT